MINNQTHRYVSTYNGYDGRFLPKKHLDGRSKKKVFVVRVEVPYFYEAQDFSLPSVLVDSALTVIMTWPSGQRTGDKSYVTSSILSWSRSHLRLMPGACRLQERRLSSQSLNYC